MAEGIAVSFATRRELPNMLMEAELQSQVAFHLTGQRPAAGLDAVDPLVLRPALLARYRDLTALRYDFPLLLVERGPEEDRVQALSGRIDRLLQDIARGEDAERVPRHVLRLERQLRSLLAEGAKGSLLSLWDLAAERLGVHDDESLRDSLGRARGALKVDGALVDCDAALPADLLAHAWRGVQEAKAVRFRDTATSLIQKLSDILRADFMRSDAGRGAESLKASIGDFHADLFDFGAMSRLLPKAKPETALPESRRTRIRALLSVLTSQRFYAAVASAGEAETAYSFVYRSCGDALAAYRERLEEMTTVARALVVAELEIAGEFREARHAAFFETYGADGLDPADKALFPDYLVCINARQLDAAETATLGEDPFRRPANEGSRPVRRYPGRTAARRWTSRIRPEEPPALRHGHRAERRLRAAIDKLQPVSIPRAVAPWLGLPRAGVNQRVLRRDRNDRRPARLSVRGSGDGLARVPGFHL